VVWEWQREVARASSGRPALSTGRGLRRSRLLVPLGGAGRGEQANDGHLPGSLGVDAAKSVLCAGAHPGCVLFVI